MKVEIKGPACDPREFTITLMFENSDNFQWFNKHSKSYGVPIGGVKVTITSKEVRLANDFNDYIQGSVFSPAYERYRERLDSLQKQLGPIETTHLQNLIDLGTYLYKTGQCMFILSGKHERAGGLGLPYHAWMA